MKKIAFMSMAMQFVKGPYYKLNDDEKKVFFPLTVKLASSLTKDDDVTVCILKMIDGVTHNGLNHYEENLAQLKKEIQDEVIAKTGVKIKYKEIESDFSETKDAFGKRFMEMFDILEENCTVLADITWGTKPSALLIMNILHFAEKFYNADIESIIYGRVLYKDEGDKTVIDETTPKVCDVTILYLLENLTSVMNLPNGEAAKHMLKQFFEM